MSDRVYELALPYTRPPLSANQRLHWAARARLVRQVQQAVGWLARSAGVPRGCGHITVGLVYTPRDRRRRDPSNLMPTQKAAVDGLVRCGVVADDTPEFVTEVMPRIAPVDTARGRRSRLTLTVRVDRGPGEVAP